MLSGPNALSGVSGFVPDLLRLSIAGACRPRAADQGVTLSVARPSRAWVRRAKARLVSSSGGAAGEGLSRAA
jgi:hypothetical protein